MVSVDKIMAYESGEMEADSVIDMFAELVKSGDAFRLQGAYGRMAMQLIEGGYLSRAGEVLNYPE